MTLRSALPALAAIVAAALLASGCARDDFADRTAVVRIGDARQTYSIDSCGLDGQTVFVVARADDGAVLQAVMGLQADDATGVPASTGASVDVDPQRDDTRLAAFGTEAWERRGMAGDPPGTITSAQLRGSRIQLAGDAVPVSADDRPVPGGAPVRLSVDARCDQLDDRPGG